MATILCVEDSAFVRKVLLQALEKSGHQVIAAEDGARGLELVRTRPDIALVFTDINMPVMDGLAMTREIRKLNPKLPIMMLTSEAEASRKLEGKEAGATGWLVKPVDPARLQEVVQRILG